MENNLGKDIEYLCKLLPDRTESSIKNKIYIIKSRLSSKRSKSSRVCTKYKTWTANELILLIKNINKPTKEITDLFPNRSKQSVLSRLNALKIESNLNALKINKEDSSISEVKNLLSNRKSLLIEVDKAKSCLQSSEEQLNSINYRLLELGIEV